MPKLKLNPQHQALKDLAQMILARWKRAIEKDEEMSGCDAVDSIGNYVELAQLALTTEPTTIVKKRRNSARTDTTIIDVRLDEYQRMIAFIEIMGGILDWAREHGAEKTAIRALIRQQRAVLRVAATKGL